MQTLEDIIWMFPSTDKGSNYHNYLKFYDIHFKRFKNKMNNLLEIGIYQGDSIKMWREYFNEGNIVGIDINMIDLKLPNTFLHLCDQSDRAQLQELINNTFDSYDIIIDDGGHMMHQQQISLGFLFPFLESNGVYVIEDLHTSGHPAYTRGEEDGNMLEILRDYNATKEIKSNLLSQSELDYLNNNIKEVIIEEGNQSPIAFITKK